jgi:hypothetical protein
MLESQENPTVAPLPERCQQMFCFFRATYQAMAVTCGVSVLSLRQCLPVVKAASFSAINKWL